MMVVRFFAAGRYHRQVVSRCDVAQFVAVLASRGCEEYSVDTYTY